MAQPPGYGHNPAYVEKVLRMPGGRERREKLLCDVRRPLLESRSEPAGGVERVELVLPSVHARIDSLLILVLGLAYPDKVGERALLSLSPVRRILE